MFPKETRILLADDSMTARGLLSKSLSELGYSDFVHASDGQDAIERVMEAEANAKPFGLIISDWKMPNVDGLQVLNFVRKSSKNPSVPFVMVTAEGDTTTVLNAIQAGADAYLLKPFSPQILTERLMKVWKSRNA